MSNIIAILSSTILTEGDYRYTTLDHTPSVEGVPHYVGHPTTRSVLDGLGAIHTPGLFAGLQPGQSVFVCKLGPSAMAAARVGGTTAEYAATPDDLEWGRLTRIDSEREEVAEAHHDLQVSNRVNDVIGGLRNVAACLEDRDIDEAEGYLHHAMAQLRKLDPLGDTPSDPLEAEDVEEIEAQSHHVPPREMGLDDR